MASIDVPLFNPRTIMSRGGLAVPFAWVCWVDEDFVILSYEGGSWSLQERTVYKRPKSEELRRDNEA